MLKFLPFMLCTSRIYPFSLGNYLRTSPIIGNLMLIRVISVEWTWLGHLNQKVNMILDNTSSHIVSYAKVGKSRSFSTLELSNMTLVFLPPNVTSVVQPLDQGIITSFKIQYKKTLLQWVLSQYGDSTWKDLRKVVPNMRQTIMWSYEVWSELDAQIFLIVGGWHVYY